MKKRDKSRHKECKHATRNVTYPPFLINFYPAVYLTFIYSSTSRYPLTSLYHCHVYRSLQTDYYTTLYYNLPMSQTTHFQQIQTFRARAVVNRS